MTSNEVSPPNEEKRYGSVQAQADAMTGTQKDSSLSQYSDADELSSLLAPQSCSQKDNFRHSISLPGSMRMHYPKDEEAANNNADEDSHQFSTHSTLESTIPGVKPANAAEAANGDDSSTGPCHMTIREIALSASLYVNLAILVIKIIAFARTLSLAVLAATVDSVLDVISQLVLTYAERTSERKVGRSSAQYPAGAARLEPIGVLTCAALMGMASFEVIKESVQALFREERSFATQDISSVWSMVGVVIVKLLLLALCRKAERRISTQYHHNGTNISESLRGAKAAIVVSDPTMEALALDHLNDALSNTVAAIALLLTVLRPWLWFFDPVGAIAISIYIIYSWYTTGKEQIEQLTGKAAPDDFIEEIYQVATHHDSRIVVDWVRAYHFGPKFLVELEVVLPKDTLLYESHDIGMDLQYEIEGREEVERCFVHIDYEKRDYDEHVVSKVPELLEKYRNPESFTRSRSY
jgi:cation diffusion facilitator family transporter